MMKFRRSENFLAGNLVAHVQLHDSRKQKQYILRFYAIKVGNLRIKESGIKRNLILCIRRIYDFTCK